MQSLYRGRWRDSIGRDRNSTRASGFPNATLAVQSSRSAELFLIYAVQIDGCAKKKLPHVRATGASQVISRIVALKTRYPRLECHVDKRDVSPASKRVVAHPDCARVSVRSYIGKDFLIKRNCRERPPANIGFPCTFLVLLPAYCVYSEYPPMYDAWESRLFRR